MNPSDDGYEVKRMQELREYNILDTLTEEEYEQITYLATVICDVPIALISFIDENRQWFKSHLGVSDSETLREHSFCAHAINSPEELMVVPDSRKDERFKDNPYVTGSPNVVFYTGIPLLSREGYGLGTICVIDHKPKELNQQQLKALKILSLQVMSLLETRRTNARLEKALQEWKAKVKNGDI
ncbi:MAG: GAF domain-containing protein [Williamsia sp.]|nr:GAF domain-containing protein [Williamsia sp.]